MAEFHHDGQRDGYVAALEAEKDGYHARIAQADSVADKDRSKLYAGRVKQVDAELARLGVKAEKAE